MQYKNSFIPVCLERMLMRFQSYSLYLAHSSGKQMYVADTLSRDFADSGCDNDTELDDEIESQVAMLIDHLPMTTKQ